MPVRKLYLASPLLFGTATVTAVGDDGRPYVCLDVTLFHPRGGGQKEDRGTLAGRSVIHVTHGEGGEVHHYLEAGHGLAVGQAVEMAIDPVERDRNADHHTLGHLIADAVETAFAVQAVAGHHWPGEARVEFAGAALPDAGQVRCYLEERLPLLIKQDLPVRVVGDPFLSRAIQIGTFAPRPCGGTHRDRLGVLAAARLRGVKIKGGRLRVGYEV